MKQITCPHCGDTYPDFDVAHVCSKGPYAPRLKPTKPKMNERIEKLFEQALEEFKAENKYATIIIPNPLKEKFAELIVQECMEQVWYTREDGINGNISEVIKERMKQHFGVEE